MRARQFALLMALGIGEAAAQDEVVIRTTTNLVEVRVVVEDAHGVPVADLKRSDFQILDNRQPQAIRLFSAYRGPNAPKDSPEAASAETSPTPSEYAVILLDWMNCSYSNRVFVQQEALRLLKSYKPRQRVAVYVLSRKNPRLLADFTYDRDALADLVERLSLDFDDMQGPAHEAAGGRGSRGGRGEGSPAAEAAIFQARNQLVDTAITFEKIAADLLHVPGRKALLWVTSGIPMTIEGSYYAPFLESALGKLNTADTAIYSIDAKGLDWAPSDSLIEFAHRTGGEAFYLSNDLTASMRSALEDMAVSYTLGFHMPEGARPGLHELTVRASRPGLKLRYREAYDPAAAIR
jgi:VWFA-related protein